MTPIRKYAKSLLLVSLSFLLVFFLSAAPQKDDKTTSTQVIIVYEDNASAEKIKVIENKYALKVVQDLGSNVYIYRVQPWDTPKELKERMDKDNNPLVKSVQENNATWCCD